jgi:predicted RNA-binding Zn ribbon-like protein
VTALRLSPVRAAWAELAAELVNTRPRATDPPEKLVGAAELDALLARAPEPAPPAGEADLPAMRQLRDALARAFEATTLDGLADALNPVLERSAGGWRLARGTAGAWELEPVAAQPVADWFGARAARGLAELAMTYGVERLHMCAADDCLCAVVDVSRNGRRRYCSRTCATRTNVRRHRAAH